MKLSAASCSAGSSSWASRSRNTSMPNGTLLASSWSALSRRASGARLSFDPPGETVVGEVLCVFKGLTAGPVLAGSPDALDNQAGCGLRIAEKVGKLLDFAKELLLECVH